MSITLTHTSRLIESCDTIFVAFPNVTATVETTIKKEGTGAAKCAITNVFTTGVAAAKVFGYTCDMSNATQIRFWIRASKGMTANHLQIFLSSAGSVLRDTLNIGTLSADVWSQQTLTFNAAPSALTAIVEIFFNITVDQNADFNLYIDKIELVSESRTFNELNILGFDTPESVDGFPQIETMQLLDASWKRQTVLAETRNIIIEILSTSNSELNFLHDWYMSANQSVVYDSETLSVVSADNRFVAERYQGLKESKIVRMNVKEKTGRLISNRPSSWA